MRVAFYNQMFGLDGRSALSVALGHWTLFRQKNRAEIERRARVAWTVRTLIKARADILGVAEVLAGQRAEFRSRLESLGYGSICFFSELNGGQPVLQDVLLASRLPAEFRTVEGFPVSEEMGGGGGMAHCYLPSLDLHVISVHLARLGNGNHGRQMGFLKERIESLSGPLVLIGDFNDDKAHVSDAFPSLSLMTGGIRTCSVVPLIKLFYFKDIDHILARGYRAAWVGKKRGKSDHRLIYADLVRENPK
jgi:endonuclease/exonuclease/phosphatase family metal-dependent hydrolase